MKSVLFRSYRPKYSGYGYGTLEFERLFKKYGYDFKLEYALEPGRRKKETVDVVIHSGFPHLFHLEAGRVNIARVMLESDSLPRLWAEVMNRMDEVWVASSFNVKTFVKGGVSRKKLFVVPDIVSKEILSPGDAGSSPPAKGFRFLSVFLDLSERKGWDVMLRAFTEAFDGDPDVEWVVQCSAPSAVVLKAGLKELDRHGVEVDNIKVNGKRPTTAELASLYRSADCYVLPTRGEGFGRPYLEAASSGLPIIATGWGGQLDFLNRRNSRLLKYRLVKVPAPSALDCYFLAGQKWAEPSVKDLLLALIEAVKNPKRALAPVNVAPYSEETVMSLIAKRLGSVKRGKHSKTLLKPEIIVYRDDWSEEFLTGREFLSILKKSGGKNSAERGVQSVAVAGTGRNAGWLAEFLEKNGIDAEFFIDRKAGRFMGKKVYSVKSIPKTKTPNLVLISTYPGSFAEWREMLEPSFNTLPVIFYRQIE
jgi:glycosyltransferase involved in cell wall biosynthesis